VIYNPAGVNLIFLLCSWQELHEITYFLYCYFVAEDFVSGLVLQNQFQMKMSPVRLVFMQILHFLRHQSAFLVGRFKALADVWNTPEGLFYFCFSYDKIQNKFRTSYLQVCWKEDKLFEKCYGEMFKLCWPQVEQILI